MTFFFGTVLPWLLVGVGAWLFVQLVRQNGRILVRLEALEAAVGRLAPAGQSPAGLPVGSPAPDFDLPDAAGARHTLAGYRDRRVLVVFFDPRCGFCLEMAPRLAALPAGDDGRPVPLVVATGGPAANEEWVRRHGVRCPVLFDTGDRVAERYQADATPTGYLIDERGRIASPLAAGDDAVLALAGPAAAGSPASAPPPDRNGPGPASGHGPPRPRGKPNKGLEHSIINRSGLKAGTPAPPFTLPTPDGGRLSLEEYRGRRVLLVFTDPECDPCTVLAPHLEAMHRSRPDLRVVVVSRRDAESNRRKADALGLTFPVGLQKLWEVSKEYAMFSLPCGYLIDEQGVIARDVAVGVEAVLALASEPASATGQSG